MIDLLSVIPKEQCEKVFGQKECDINGEFLGFMNEYYHLSKMIPKHFTVIDLGCAYNPQCFYFTEHKRYIAVDVSDCVKFQADNCDVFNKTINQFIQEDLHNYDLDETFAICSYVFDWYNNKDMIKSTFKNLFMFYPSNKEEKLDFIKTINKNYNEKSKTTSISN